MIRLSSLIILGSIYKRNEEQKRVVNNRFEVAKMNRPASKQAALKKVAIQKIFQKKNPDIYTKKYTQF